jgi:hypothetical protein
MFAIRPSFSPINAPYILCLENGLGSAKTACAPPWQIFFCAPANRKKDVHTNQELGEIKTFFMKWLKLRKL